MPFSLKRISRACLFALPPSRTSLARFSAQNLFEHCYRARAPSRRGCCSSQLLLLEPRFSDTPPGERERIAEKRLKRIPPRRSFADRWNSQMLARYTARRKYASLSQLVEASRFARTYTSQHTYTHTHAYVYARPLTHRRLAAIVFNPVRCGHTIKRSNSEHRRNLGRALSRCSRHYSFPIQLFRLEVVVSSGIRKPPLNLNILACVAKRA